MEDIIQDNILFHILSNGFIQSLATKFQKSTSDKNTDLEAALLAPFNEEQLRKNRVILKNIRRFCSILSKQWKESNRTETKFLNNNEIWLKSDVSLFHEEEIAQPSASSAGHPSLAFEESSEKAKRRKIKEITEKSTTTRLVHVTKSQLWSQGKHDAAKLLIEAVDTTPTRAGKIQKTWSETKNKPVNYTPEEALSLLIEAKLTKAQYLKIRLQAKQKNAIIYPSYTKIRAAKEKCYPYAQSITISKLVVESTLQALLDHTASRIILAQEDVFKNHPSENISKKMTLICKWGCDGSTEHSGYKQVLPEGCMDTDIFITSMVPLQLFSRKAEMYRRGHTRKISRETTNEGLFCCLLASSDPYITGLRIVSAKRSAPLAQEVLKLLSVPKAFAEPPDKAPSGSQTTSTSGNTSDSDDDTDYEW